MTRRLIETWLPIAALGEESVRERRSMTALPPTYYLHVWWARRPLVASRAAILAALLPADADHEKFMHLLGIHGDPVASRKRIDQAKRSGERFEGDAYSYPRAFSHVPTRDDRIWLRSELDRLGLSAPTVLDPTAGGGSIPFESARLGFETFGNDLNPVATFIERATIEFPIKYGVAIKDEFEILSRKFLELREQRLKEFFPSEPDINAIPTNYLWARTITCPHCDGVVPMSPNWRLDDKGNGVCLQVAKTDGPRASKRKVSFTIVRSAKEQSRGTVSGGDAKCCYEDCARLIDSDEIKRQAQAGQMGDQLYAIAFKRRMITGRTKAGKAKEKWVRDYRAPRPEDDVRELAAQTVAERMPEWEALDLVPTEKVPTDINDERPIKYGMPLWRNLFSPRQLIGHVESVRILRELYQLEVQSGPVSGIRAAAYGYLAIALDTLLNYNCRSCRWDTTIGRVRSIFDRHDFAFVSSYAEMPPLLLGQTSEWAIRKTARCIEELVELSRPPEANREEDLVEKANGTSKWTPPKLVLLCGSADSLQSIQESSIDCVVMDPPYYDNVMYADLSDFFYVWLKRTAGYVYPELFRRQLTDKENEAVANPAKFKGEKGAKALAGRDYQQRMAAIFAEMRRVLKPDGIMTLMFTHKATGAWDALTKGLMEAGFIITASWPINTEAEGSLHIKDKSAANSTIFLVCRPRGAKSGDSQQYWEDVEPLVAQAVRERIKTFQEGGIKGVDLYLSCFGPALEAFSRHWPLKRGQPRPEPETRKRRRQTELFEEEWDPYAVTPEDALDAARREVKRWRLDQLTHMKAHAELDPLTSWFVLAWDAFAAPAFPYDEALRLARVCGVNLDTEVVGHLAEKKASDLILWDSATRAAKGMLGVPDGRTAMIDAIHHAAHAARSRTLDAARELLQKHRVDTEPAFLSALEAVLEVLPVGKGYAKLDLPDAAQGAGADFDALESLRRLAFAEQVGEPEQLKLWLDESAATT